MVNGDEELTNIKWRERRKITVNAKGFYQWEVVVEGFDQPKESIDARTMEVVAWMNSKYGSGTPINEEED